MTTPTVTPPRAPPSWWPPSRAAANMGVAIIAAVLGTGGCGAVLAGTAQVLSASNATVTRRLDAIEAKLDAWRAEQAEAQARAGVAARDVQALQSQLRGVESRLDACERRPTR